MSPSEHAGNVGSLPPRNPEQNKKITPPLENENSRLSWPLLVIEPTSTIVSFAAVAYGISLPIITLIISL